MLHVNDVNDLKTRKDCDNAVAQIEQRKADLQGDREFEFSESYCIGGSDENYTMKEPEAMVHLRREMLQSEGYDRRLVKQGSWEDLKAMVLLGEDGFHRFDVTRKGCHGSILYVREV